MKMILLVVVVAACGGGSAAFERAKPVFDPYCAKCHAKSGKLATAKKLDHFDMTSYPFGGHHAMEISGEIRKSLAIGGGKASARILEQSAVLGGRAREATLHMAE